MTNLLAEIFENDLYLSKLKGKLPYIFKIAELELSRGGRAGMEVGTLRERAIISFFIYALGEDRVVLDVPINESDIDFYVKLEENINLPVSVKTKSGSNFKGVKLKWTVDWKKVKEFYSSYYPNSDMIFVQVNWGGEGLFAYIPKDIQLEVFNILGRERYIKLPKQGTNPRGIEINSEALEKCLKKTKYNINISWKIEEINYNPYERWLELWQND